MSDAIHPSAIIDPRARLDAGVRVGAFSVIGPEVTLESGVEIGHHAVLEGRVALGPRVKVGHGSVVGGAREVRVHHTDQLDVRQLRVDEHVVLAHVARADDTRAHLRSTRHQPVISSGSSMEPSAPFTIP